MVMGRLIPILRGGAEDWLVIISLFLASRMMLSMRNAGKEAGSDCSLARQVVTTFCFRPSDLARLNSAAICWIVASLSMGFIGPSW